MLARRSANVLHDPLGGQFGGVRISGSSPLLDGYNEPEILRSSTRQICLTGASCATAQHWRAQPDWYRAGHLERLSFVRRGRDLGFSLDEVRELLRLSDDRCQSCTDVDRIARSHLIKVERKGADLLELGAKLRQLVDKCQHGTIAECRIIEALAPVGKISHG
ncbi:MAG: MerR family DNA-binding protein [Pseudomonadota bacterium]|nr:MerR family DNA-binding protein [Pseudomonadota bacterium]